MTLEVMTILGARPQFIKAAALSLQLRTNYSGTIREKVVHTGQHSDDFMSEIFFTELGMPKPDFQLNTSSGTHGAVTGSIMASLDPILIKERPDLVLVYGDTNSTLAGALSAAKLHIPIVHIEAGMRSGNLRMPEEVNRIVTDRVSALNIAPSSRAMQNLWEEGLGSTAFYSGDIMFDCINLFASRNLDLPTASFGVPEEVFSSEFALTTIHRQENTDDRSKLAKILEGLNLVAQDLPVIVPVHPRLKLRMEEFGLLEILENRVFLVRPLSYLEMIGLQKRASVIVTDSGGIQKEAFYLRVPCVTIREETEWPETIELGWNRLCGPHPAEIRKSVSDSIGVTGLEGSPFGDGTTAHSIAQKLMDFSTEKLFKNRSLGLG